MNRSRQQRIAIDTVVHLTVVGISVLWMFGGHSREGVILATINYWGMPWNDERR